MKKSTIPEELWGVHRTHCCSEHGCKYFDDNCPVVTKDIKQDYLCEDCQAERAYGKNILAEHIRDNIWYVGETITGKHITYIDGAFIIRTSKEMKMLYNWEKNSSQK